MAHAWTRENYVGETTATIVNADDGTGTAKEEEVRGVTRIKKLSIKKTINLASNALKEGDINNDDDDENL